MATTYYLDSTPADVSVTGLPDAISGTHSLDTSQPGSTATDSVSPKAGAIDGYAYLSPAGDPGAGGTSGDFTIQINVTSWGSGDAFLLRLARVNSGGAVQQMSGLLNSNWQTGTGTRSYTFSAQSLGTWSSGERLAVVVYVLNGNPHGGGVTAAWETGGALDTVDAPWGGGPVAQNVTAVGLGSAAAFGSPAVAAGLVTVQASSLASQESFGAATASATVTATVSGVASQAAFGTTTIQTAVTVATAGLSSNATLGAVGVVAGPVTVAAPGLSSAASFGAPTAALSGGPQTASPAGIDSSSALGAVSVSSTVTTAVSGITSSAAFGTAAASAGGVTASVFGIGPSVSFGVPTASPGGVSIQQTGLGSSAAFGTVSSSVSGGGQTDAAAGLGSSAAFGSPMVLAVVDVSVSGLASVAEFGVPAEAPGGVAAGLSALQSSPLFGTPVLVAGAVAVLVPGLASAASFGPATIPGAGRLVWMKRVGGNLALYLAVSLGPNGRWEYV